MNSKRIKIIIIITLITLIGLLVFNWLNTHSYISVVVADNNSSGGDIVYKIDSNKNAIEETTKSKTLKKLVKRDSYGVTVTQDNKSYFKSVDTGGFLSTSTIEAKLQPEKHRSFVGDNPDDCNHFNGTVLISWVCDGDYTEISTHIPATAESPTYKLKRQAPEISGSLKGVTSTREGTLALVSSLKYVGGEADIVPGSYYVQIIDNSLSTVKERELTNLSKDSNYSIESLREGFILYNEDYSEVLYYKSIDDPQPKSISLYNSYDDEIKPQGITTSSHGIIAHYSNVNGNDADNLSEKDIKNTKNYFVFTDGANEPRRFEIKGKLYSATNYCWENKLCLLSTDGLEVYSATNPDEGALYTVPNVIDVSSTSDTILMVTSSFLYSFNPDNREGYAEYSFGDYQYCGVQPDNATLTVCVSGGGKNALLLIDRGKINNDNIDKKILALKKTEGINVVTITRNVIYINVEAGELVRDKSTNTFGYNEIKKVAAIKKANEAVDNLGIDRNKYIITVLPE